MALDRRAFLANLTGAMAAVSAPAAARNLAVAPQNPYDKAGYGAPGPVQLKSCWLDVSAPFLVEDPALGLHSELLFTATAFPGQDGFRNSNYGTEYRIDLFDARGREVPLGAAGKMVVAAMHPARLPLAELAGRKSFWGGARIRLAPSGTQQVSHAGDLFSAGFVRWNTPQNFDNVHAHPAAPAQMTGRFFYSMPFPSLDEYHLAFALFNPNDAQTAGVVKVFDSLGRVAVERKFALAPHTTELYRLGDMRPVDSPREVLAIAAPPQHSARAGGVVMVANDSEAVPYAYTLMKGRANTSFTVEHPLHFADRPVTPGRTSPYGEKKNFPAEAFLYAPMLFAGKRIGGLELDTRLYLSSSRWRESLLWLMPFVSDGRGMIQWVSNRDEGLRERIAPADVVDQGLVKLSEFQSCRVDAARLPLPAGFSGGFGVATLPPTSHSLMKIEVRAREWGRVAFTHFRPGGHFHKKYRSAAERDGLATDYIVSGCQARRRNGVRTHDALFAVMNIEFEDENAGSPHVQLFGSGGLVAERDLGEFPPLACRHILLSELFPDLETRPGELLTLRMTDARAMCVVSALHLDYERRDLALEHGSDRHSTFADFKC